MEYRKIYVGNLPPAISERDLEDEFIRFGTIRSVWVARKPPGFAFIEMEDPRDADDAVRKLDGFQGWRVELSRTPKPSRGGGGYGGGAGLGGSYRDAPRGYDSYRRERSPPPVRRRSPSYDGHRRASPSPPPRRRSPSYSPRRSPGRVRERSYSR
ncbi:hypothetical protein WJX81_003729 [Elliptochloris bilobata]|uniref:RRM domain-containing protein n=1 Tax=Elliptochloris bilobata TaxID=381761 RepID=A0AAW1SJW8_9CHLO